MNELCLFFYKRERMGERGNGVGTGLEFVFLQFDMLFHVHS